MKQPENFLIYLGCDYCHAWFSLNSAVSFNDDLTRDVPVVRKYEVCLVRADFIGWLPNEAVRLQTDIIGLQFARDRMIALSAILRSLQQSNDFPTDTYIWI